MLYFYFMVEHEGKLLNVFNYLTLQIKAYILNIETLFLLFLKIFFNQVEPNLKYPYLKINSQFKQFVSQLQVYFQQNCARPHLDNIIKYYQQKNFPRRWIDRGGRIPSPPRSFDITLPDFQRRDSLWSYQRRNKYSRY